MAIMELWAWNWALAGAIFLIAVPGPGWRRGSLGGIRFTAGRFSL